MNKRSWIYVWIIWDLFAAILSWVLLFAFRKLHIEQLPLKAELFFGDPNFILALLLIPAFWFFLFYVIGTYTNVFRKSRLESVFKTFLFSLIGCTILFFLFLLDDQVKAYVNYYQSFLVLFLSHFILTLTGRFAILSYTKQLLKSGKAGFNTLIIGGNEKAIDLYKDLSGRPYKLGYLFRGFIDLNGNSTNGLVQHLPKLGKLTELNDIIHKEQIEEVILAIESSEHPLINNIINRLSNENVVIKIIPDMYDIMSGSVKMNHIIGAALIEIYPDLMSRWQMTIKRLFDILVSSLALIALLPVYSYIALRVKLSSKGSVFYLQERIGLKGKPFHIIKFRSMYTDAEKNGPSLSSENDERVTAWGKIMRKYRLDELPQFWNVLVGDMSLVGPRPERAFYVNQIAQQAPHYNHIFKIKPGITSLGMVKFGYASNVEEMVKRLKFDMIYIENISFSMDLKVLGYTVITLLHGKGK